MTNGPKSAILYAGITGNLPHRVWQHKNKLIAGFTSRYNLTSLVYYERFFYPDAAIAPEKEIKGWRRSKKIKLIESMNPGWEDLARDWADVFKPEPAANQGEIPRPARENAGLRDDSADDWDAPLQHDPRSEPARSEDGSQSSATKPADKTHHSR